MSCLCHVTLFFVFFFILRSAAASAHFISFHLLFAFSFFLFYFFLCVLRLLFCFYLFGNISLTLTFRTPLINSKTSWRSLLQLPLPSPALPCVSSHTSFYDIYFYDRYLCLCACVCVCVPLLLLYASVKSSWNINLLFYCVYAACAALHDLWPRSLDSGNMAF